MILNYWPTDITLNSQFLPFRLQYQTFLSSTLPFFSYGLNVNSSVPTECRQPIYFDIALFCVILNYWPTDITLNSQILPFRLQYQTFVSSTLPFFSYGLNVNSSVTTECRQPIYFDIALFCVILNYWPSDITLMVNLFS